VIHPLVEWAWTAPTGLLNDQALDAGGTVSGAALSLSSLKRSKFWKIRFSQRTKAISTQIVPKKEMCRTMLSRLQINRADSLRALRLGSGELSLRLLSDLYAADPGICERPLGPVS
jgi:hypothetical protein